MACGGLSVNVHGLWLFCHGKQGLYPSSLRTRAPGGRKRKPGPQHAHDVPATQLGPHAERGEVLPVKWWFSSNFLWFPLVSVGFVSFPLVSVGFVSFPLVFLKNTNQKGFGPTLFPLVSLQIPTKRWSETRVISFGVLLCSSQLPIKPGAESHCASSRPSNTNQRLVRVPCCFLWLPFKTNQRGLRIPFCFLRAPFKTGPNPNVFPLGSLQKQTNGYETHFRFEKASPFSRLAFSRVSPDTKSTPPEQTTRRCLGGHGKSSLAGSP